MEKKAQDLFVKYHKLRLKKERANKKKKSKKNIKREENMIDNATMLNASRALLLMAKQRGEALKKEKVKKKKE